MEFRLLGPLEVVERSRPLSLGTLKQRLMLAALLIERGKMLSRAQLIDELWGEDPPATAVNVLQVYAAGLRRAIGPRLESLAGGYRIGAEPQEVDAWRFEEMVRSARERARLEPSAASKSLSEALALWRGPALAGIPPGPRTRAAAFQLEESRLQAIEARFDAELALGNHDEVSAEINGMVEAHPTRERLTGLLMLALHRGGRSADALTAYGRLSKALDAELGVDPGDELVALEHAIRRQDPTLDAPNVAHLPIPAGRFIGRREEIASVGELLNRSRLLTLVGPGGCGKTRLALELARASASSHHDGARFVSFAGVGAGASVPAEIARALELREQPGEAPLETLAAWLRHRRILLILDNCEHVIDAVSTLCGDLLGSCSGLRILTTGREPLMLAGETVWVVPGLALPALGSSVEQILDSDSVRLLADRAAIARPGRPGIDVRGAAIGKREAPVAAAICRRLDGLPLAIELAAARLRSLSLSEISSRLDHRLDLLSGPSRTGVQRHQTMRATIEWSHDLLDAADRALFRRLSVFAGGFDLAAAEGVMAEPLNSDPDPPRPVLEGLPRLVDRSVVDAQPGLDGRTRYRLLGTVREYAAERLAAAGEVRVMTDRHAAWFMANAETAAGAVDPETFVRWAGTEHENLGAALDWYLGQGAQPGLALALAAPLWVYWYQSGRSREGLAWMRRALDAAPADLTISRGLGLRGAASLARSSGDLAVARELGEECLGVYRALGDDAGIASALNGLGATAQTQGDLEGAVRYGLESVEVGSRTPNLRGLAAAQCNLGIALRCVGRRDEADAMFAISLKGFRELGARRGEAAVLNNLAIAARQRRQNARARQLALEALRIYSDLDFAEGMADAVEAVAALEITGGRAAEGLRLYEVAGQERGLIGSVIVTPDERADRAVALAAAIKSLGSSNVQALLASTSNLRLRGVVDELLATHAAGC